jgi:hypothetical protein
MSKYHAKNILFGLAQDLLVAAILAGRARRLPFWQFPYRSGGGVLFTPP